jgi:ABC-2 type transport system permease protein
MGGRSTLFWDDVAGRRMLRFLLPPFAPVLMSTRVAAGDAAAWQVALALGLMLASIAAAVWVAARIYASSVRGIEEVLRRHGPGSTENMCESLP